MGFLKKYADKLYLKQWGLGFMQGDIADIIRNRRTDLRFEWMPLDGPGISHADPFIFRTDSGQVHLLFESVSSYVLNGTISLMIFDENMKALVQKEVLNTNDHLSYPFVYHDNGKIYVFPENGFSGSLYCYEYSQEDRILKNKQKIMDLPLIDPTILRYGGKYWMFATLLGPAFNSDLHIFHSDSLLGPYKAHVGNPVKKNLVGSRPAGNFIHVDGQIYRPAQNSLHYYGESITINRVITLNETEYKEEKYMEIKPSANDEFNYGIHTINAIDNLIVADGLKTYFQPIRQLGRKLKNLIN